MNYLFADAMGILLIVGMLVRLSSLWRIGRD